MCVASKTNGLPPNRDCRPSHDLPLPSLHLSKATFNAIARLPSKASWNADW